MNYHLNFDGEQRQAHHYDTEELARAAAEKARPGAPYSIYVTGPQAGAAHYLTYPST